MVGAEVAAGLAGVVAAAGALAYFGYIEPRQRQFAEAQPADLQAETSAALLKAFLLYRTYHGSAMSPLVATASIAALMSVIHTSPPAPTRALKSAMNAYSLGRVTCFCR